MNEMSESVRRGVRSFLICMPLVLGLTRCGGPNGQVRTPSQPIIAPSGPEITVEAGKDVPIRASARGADRYNWELEGEGNISATTGEAILFTSPNHEGTARLNVIASNQYGNSTKTSLTIIILAKASVQLDRLAIPAGWMLGTGTPERFISLETEHNGCASPQTCSRFTYKPGGGWGGISWWPQKCGPSGTPAAWSMVKNGTCSINVLQMGNFKAINRLTFRARGERGGEKIEFKVGAVDVAPKPGTSLGRVALKPEWEQYEIDLGNVDLSNAIGLFFWLATDEDNPQGAIFYLDDIKFEGVK